MSRHQRTLEEIRSLGLQALDAALGPADLVRFLQQFEHGRGDYTSDRQDLLRDSVDDLRREWLKNRES